VSARVSIVLPLTGDPDGALRSLLALAEVPDEPAHEVVVVDDASVGLEPLLQRLDGDATVVRRPARGGLLRAWASGLQRVTGDVVVLLAGPVSVAPGFLAPLVAALDDPRVVAATAGAGEPVAAPALALRRAAAHPAVDPDTAQDAPVSDVPDALAAAAVLARVAAHGAVHRVPGSSVAPAAADHAATMPAVPRRDAAARGLERHPPGTPPELTIVIPTLDAAGDRLRRCVRAIQDRTDAPYEIVVVDNGAPPQGFTAPVNAGLCAARGRYAVVCNDDVEVLPGWWTPLRQALDAGHPVAFPWTVDGAMREDFAAWCFAVSREALERHAAAPGEFLDPELVVWYQDTDLLTRLRAAGTPPLLVRDAHVRHGLSETVATEDPLLRAWIDRRVEQDRIAFQARHGAGVAGAFAVGAD
jgi:GT2 family glycosyltransferase